MRPICPYIDPIEKPLELLGTDLAGKVTSPLQPGELLLLKAFAPKTKAIPGPIQNYSSCPNFD
jgi:hypothetical protein